ncbi:MAG: hypothetical protein ACRELB_00105 [Polyangiaceae bacterium]
MTRLAGIMAVLLVLGSGCGPALNFKRSSYDAPHCDVYVEDEPGSRNYVLIGSTQDNFSEERAHPQPVVTRNQDGTVSTYAPEPEYGNVFYLLPEELRYEAFSVVIAFDRDMGPGYPPRKVCQETTVDGSKYTDLWVPLRGVPEQDWDDVLGERAKKRAAEAARRREQEQNAPPVMVPAGGG